MCINTGLCIRTERIYIEVMCKLSQAKMLATPLSRVAYSLYYDAAASYQGVDISLR